MFVQQSHTKPLTCQCSTSYESKRNTNGDDKHGVKMKVTIDYFKINP